MNKREEVLVRSAIQNLTESDCVDEKILQALKNLLELLAERT
jgi:hypothetical protein